MADKKGASTPGWQKKAAAAEPSTEEGESKSQEAQKSPLPSTTTTTKEEAGGRAALLEQAKEFLEHEDIRDASTDRKISFLESKGLTNDEIGSLLGVFRNADASSSSPADSGAATTISPLPPTPSTSAPSPSSTAAISSPSTPRNPPAPSSSSSITPNEPRSDPQPPAPIITYPEFLVHAHRPPPLVTRQRLLTTLYATLTAGLVVRGAQTYLVGPMLETLGAARHALFGAAGTNLETLNEKLSGVVSAVSDASASAAAKHSPARPQQHGFVEREEQEDGESSVASDPSELFHRDAGVQTSLPGTPSSASVAVDDILAKLPGSNLYPRTLSLGAEQGGSGTANEEAEESLRNLRARAAELAESGRDAEDSAADASKELAGLQAYLEDLRFGLARASSAGRWDQARGKWIPASSSSSGAAGGGNKDDEVARIKAEIRSVKGVLLSARSFPAGGGQVRGVR